MFLYENCFDDCYSVRVENQPYPYSNPKNEYLKF